MNAYDLIVKKRDGGILSDGEIKFLIDAFMAGDVPDFQMAAFLMAVYFRGLSQSETKALTIAMADSGERLDLSAIPGPKVDKHSTGGVGDKTTLVVVPLVAACGLPVAKMSGRSLGYTGGTLDKLESIPGFRTDLSRDEFLEQVARVGAVICGQTGNLTPADKRVYALRDATATVESVPLVAASVMSKKIAAGADGIVLDVKVGRAAFAAAIPDALELARIMVSLAKAAGRRAVAWLSSMDQPLGRAVGNALEVEEAILALRGEGPKDLVELSVALGAEMLVLGGQATDLNDARTKLSRALHGGDGLEKLAEIIRAQAGDAAVVHDVSRLPKAAVTAEALADKSGWIHAVDGLEVGRLAVDLGAGRAGRSDSVDPGVGVVLAKKAGDRVEKGETLATIHAASGSDLKAYEERLRSCYEIGEAPPPSAPLLIQRVSQDGL